MITHDTRMCTSDSIELKPAPLKPYQDNVFKRPAYLGMKMQSTRHNADKALEIKSRGQEC
jgi:hypothetical protein